MLGRYHIVRGRRPPGDPLPEGTRIDVRKHTRHVLRPDPKLVADFLRAPDEPARWTRYAKRYRELLAERWRDDRAPFDALAEQAREGDVWIGCSCPTRKQPDVQRCHTVLALRFMREKYKDLEVELPA
jgi:hypothetical protein